MTPPTCSTSFKAWQGLAHAGDTWLCPKPCSNFSAFTWSLTCLLLTPNLHWRLCEPCVELSHASDTLASTCLCGASPRSHDSPYGSLHLWPSVSPLHRWTNDRWEEPAMTGKHWHFVSFMPTQQVSQSTHSLICTHMHAGLICMPTHTSPSAKRFLTSLHVAPWLGPQKSHSQSALLLSLLLNRKCI